MAPYRYHSQQHQDSKMEIKIGPVNAGNHMKNMKREDPYHPDDHVCREKTQDIRQLHKPENMR